MNRPSDERDSDLQLRAEQAERQGLPQGVDPQLDRYRLVLRALRQPLSEQLPEGFAALVAARLPLPEDKHVLEDALMTLLMLVMAAAALVYVRPVVASVLSSLQLQLPDVPWPLLLAGGVSVVVAWAIDRGAVSLQRNPMAQR